MRKYYLAIDIGASSGRHILGSLNEGKIELEEVYRFENGMKEVDGHLCWDTDALFRSIKEGMKKCCELGKIPCAMAIDTWGVDFMLLDSDDNRIGNAVGYRDSRTAGMDEEVFKIIPEKELYALTGTQKQPFNTIYQLMALKLQNPEQLDQAETMLLSPDYYSFMLTGEKATEYTIASTTQLLDQNSHEWNFDLIEKLGLPRKIFTEIRKPGTKLGRLRPEIEEEVGFNCDVIMTTSHDTASAVLAVPAVDDDFVYISSGTWSLMGLELDAPIMNEESRLANLTNEGGYDYTVRFLNNIMGLWMIQSVRHEYNDGYSFAELCSMAEEAKDFPSRVDVGDASFFAPDSMIGAIREYCARTAQQIPETPGEISTVVYQSLADCYGETIEMLEKLSGKSYEAINIIGGGSNADYLNQLTANATGKTVYAGPGEATALGNIVAQMLESGEFDSVKAARKCIFDSFAVKTFKPGK